MRMRILFTATFDGLSVYVETFSHPEQLLFAVEDGNPKAVTHQVWDQYISKHPETLPRAMQLHLPTPLPRWRLERIAQAFIWLVGQVVGQRMRVMREEER